MKWLFPLKKPARSVSDVLESEEDIMGDSDEEGKHKPKPPEPALAPVKVAVGSGLEAEDRKKYLESAQRLGMTTASILKLVLEEAGIEIYPYDKVCDYMDSVFGKRKKHGDQTWGWRGLRSTDITSDRITDRDNRDVRLEGPYKKAIPLPVLLTIEKVIGAIPEGMEIQFLITDEVRSEDRVREELARDPFLAVKIRGYQEFFVIERWDEPAFRL